MLSRYLASALLAAHAALAGVIDRRKASFNWGSDKVRGVNIGGWLVLEPWITPSIFEQFDASQGIVDEFTLSEKLGAAKAGEILKPHWDSWVGYEDFQRIADAGMNVVRIPIGFWAYDTFGSPYAKGAAPYMDAALDWARGTGLKVIIDLHGAPGSQNGYDNSGQRMDSPQWTQGDTVDQTLSVLNTIAEKYGTAEYEDVVAGIQLLNEPAGYTLDLNTIKQFDRDGYGKVRAVGETPVVVHDAFQSPASYNGFMAASDNDVRNVAIDHHEYQVFDTGMVAWSAQEHRQGVCNNKARWEGADKWTFVGEWTGAMTDCAKWLNGYGRGARYDGSFEGSSYVGDCAFASDLGSWDQQRKDDTRWYIETQLEAFEKVDGWIFWNFKTEAAPEWDWSKLSDAGVFPNPVTDRKFSAIC
ncbi:glucan exo-1,3-beta-glucosidase [Diplodia intermedia]|uniref:Glucan exo-1,3-beta-glucosidase n=1 Tax=Diplodia intermedia TaxID=856260 RepID=A0ABR3T4E0_9PEZI